MVRREERHEARLAEMLTEVCHRLTGRTGTGDWQLRELLEDLKQRPRLEKKKRCWGNKRRLQIREKYIKIVLYPFSSF